MGSGVGQLCKAVWGRQTRDAAAPERGRTFMATMLVPQKKKGDIRSAVASSAAAAPSSEAASSVCGLPASGSRASGIEHDTACPSPTHSTESTLFLASASAARGRELVVWVEARARAQGRHAPRKVWRAARCIAARSTQHNQNLFRNNSGELDSCCRVRNERDRSPYQLARDVARTCGARKMEHWQSVVQSLCCHLHFLCLGWRRAASYCRSTQAILHRGLGATGERSESGRSAPYMQHTRRSPWSSPRM